MNTVILLFLLGVVLLAFEVFVPGAILGIIGGVVMLIGSILAFQDFGIGGGLLATFAAVALLGATIYAEFFLLPKTRFGKRLFIRETVSATSQPPLAPAESVVGRPGVALTPLAPTGIVLVDGKRYEAFSQSGFLAKDAVLHVVSLDNFRLIVSKT